MTFFYRRSLTDRSVTSVNAVYAVLPTSGKPNPVPVVADFPAGWRPTENPGQCLAEPGTPARYFVCSVPRSQFRQYERIDEAAALALYPDPLR